MFQNLKIFATAQSMAQHAANRQSVVAQNVANADTPGYKARDVTDFATLMSTSRAGTDMRVTRSGHVTQSGQTTLYKTRIDRNSEPSPNGNTVSVESEMLKAIDAERQHSRALAIYQSSLNILRASVGR